MGAKIARKSPDLVSKYRSYTILRLLGQGLDGRVYEICEKETKKRYALKIIEIRTTDQYHTARQVHTIALKLKNLNHLHILPIHHIDFRDEIDYYGNLDQYLISIMDLSMITLDQLISGRTRFNMYWTEEELLRILYDIADALHHAQQIGIPHEDIKDRNILFCDNKYVLADFGDSKKKALTQQKGEALTSSINFMSPELYQAFTNRLEDYFYDHFKSDVYSLGLVFLKMGKLSLITSRLERNLLREIDELEQMYQILPGILRKMLVDQPEKRISWFDLKKHLINKVPNVKTFTLEEDLINNKKILSNLNPNKKPQVNYLEHENIAKGYYHLGIFDEALKNYLHAADIYVNLNRADETIIKYKTSIANCYRNLGIARKALENDYKCFDMIEKFYPNEHPRKGDAFSNIGHDYSMLNDRDSSIEHHKKALEIRKKNFGDTNLSVADSFSCLAYEYYELENYRESLTNYLEALMILKKTFKEKKHRSLATFYDKIGNNYSKLGDVKKCLFYKEKALKVRKKIFGEDHILVARTYQTTGESYSLVGRHSDALSYFQKAHDIGGRQEGITQNEMGVMKLDMARAHYNIGSYKVALDIAKAGLKMLEDSPDKDLERISQAYNLLGSIYRALGQINQVLLYMKKSYQILVKLHGKENPLLVNSLTELGDEFTRSGDLNQALEYKAKALKITEEFYGERNQMTANCYSSLASTLSEFGLINDAIESEKKAFALVAKIKGPESLEAGISLQNFGKIYAKAGDFMNSVAQYSHALGIIRKIQDANPHLYADVLHGLGESCAKDKNYDEAFRCKFKSLETRKALEGENTLNVAETIESIGMTYQEVFDYGNAIEYFDKARLIYGQCFDNKDNKKSKHLAAMIAALKDKFCEEAPNEN